MNANAPRYRFGAIGAILLALAFALSSHDRAGFYAAWLVAWLFFAWVAMGGLVGVWIHTLTGGEWGEAIREPALTAASLLPVLSLLFLPVLIGVNDLYPWAAEAMRGAARWEGELSAPDFKRAWLQTGSFVLRSVGVLLVWNVLAWLQRRPSAKRSAGIAAVSLIVYAFAVGVAAVDWIMSLMPLWYSSVFGLEIAVGQALAGLAFCVLLVARRRAIADSQIKRDLGNMLLTFVLTWAYLAFCQYLIVWAENLPHEIFWYEHRSGQPWLALGIAIVVLRFVVPFFALLFRSVKERASRMVIVAACLLLAHLMQSIWLVLPSVAERIDLRAQIWLLPLCLAGFAAVCRAALPEALAESVEVGDG